jgi:hypothetical protein
MKNLILILFTGILLSCSSDSSDDNSNGTIKWKFKANGVQYELSENFPYSATSGQCSYLGQPSAIPTIMLSSPVISSGNREIMLTFTFQNESTGTSIIDNSVVGNSASLVINGQDLYSTLPNLGEITLNISQIAISLGGITKGTFSGTMVSVNQQMQTIQITEGSFEAIRIQ